MTLKPHGLRRTSYGSELQIGRVESELEVPATDAVTTSLEYRLVPVN